MSNQFFGFEDIDLNDIDYKLLYEAFSNVVSGEVEAVRYTYIDINEINLEDLSKQAFGITDPIGQLAEWLEEQLEKLASWFADTVDSIFRTIWDTVIEPVISGIRSVVDTIWNTVKDIPTQITNAINSIVSSIQSFFEDFYNNTIAPALTSIQDTIINTLTSVVDGFINWLWEGIQSLIDGVLSAIDAVSSAVTTAVSTITSALSDLGNSILEALTNVGQQIINGVKSFIDQISQGLQSLGSQITTFFTETLPKALGDLWNQILSGLQTVQNAIVSNVQGFVDWLWTGIQTLIDGVITFFSETLPSALGSLWEQIQGGFQWVIDQITSGVQGFINWLWEGIQSIGKSILNAVSSVSNAITQTINALSQATDTIVSNVQSAVGGAIESITKTVTDVVGQIWEGIKGLISGLGDMVASGFTVLTNAVSTLVNNLSTLTQHINQLGQMVMGGFNQFVQFFQSIPEQFGNLVKPITDFFARVGEGIASLVNTIITEIQKFTQDPAGWISKNIIEPFWEGLQFIGGKIVEFGGFVVDKLKDFGNWLLSGLSGIAQAISDAVSNAVRALVDFFKGIGEKIAGAFNNIIQWMVDRFKETIKSGLTVLGDLKDMITTIFTEQGISSPPYLTIDNVIAAMGTGTFWSVMLFGTSILMQLPLRALTFVLRHIASGIQSVLGDVELHLKFLGAGGVVKFNLGKALGGAIWITAEELTKIYEKWLDYSALGMLFWYGQTISRLITYHLRNYIPIELPTTSELQKVLVRSKAADKLPDVFGKKYEDVVDAAKYYLSVRGYSDYVVKMLIAEEDEFYTTIKDRFNIERRLPLSLKYYVISPSEASRMIIRDIVIPPEIRTEDLRETIEKMFMITGMNKDMAALYFLFHFKYPPPEKLADFYWRAMTGTTWLEEALVEPALLDAFGYGFAKDAKAPTELSFKADVLNKAMRIYFRWHDYFPGTWMKDFTSDTSIMLELTADLPTRLDMRWLARWGILEHISHMIPAGQTPMVKPIKELIEALKNAKGTETVAKQVSPEITLDVRLLARMLEATGYHPLYVPILAVAHIHQALTDEMTLLRTGFLNAFKEGLATADVTEQLMSGLFVIKFKTGYINPVDGKPVEFDYNKPVYWLPAERRLLQLRMVFDRYIDLMRDMIRETVYGIRRLAIKPDLAITIIKNYFYGDRATGWVGIQKLWGDSVKALTGVDWKPALDLDYINAFVKYAELTRVIETKTWIRNYIIRVMAWITYRFTYGWVELKDYMDLTQTLVDKGWLTEEEKKFFDTIAEKAIGIVRRETIPTPLTLATMAEYMVIDDQTIEEVFKDQRVVEKYQELYKKYIKIKPFKSDYKTMLNAAAKALRKGVIGAEEWEKLKREALSFGFHETELKLIERKIHYEQLVELAKEKVPTPATLATWAEYVVIPQELVEKSITEYKLDEAYHEIAKTYIRVKPIKSDYKSLLTRARRALIKGVITESDWKKYLEQAPQFGFTPIEISIIEEIAKLEELIELAKERVPTPSTLAVWAEYVVIPPELIEKSIIEYKLDEDYVEIVKRYIQVKPIKADYKSLLSVARRALRYGAITEEVWKSFLDKATQFGFTQIEIEIQQQIADLEVLIENSREYVPTPSQLVSFAEYIAISPELIDQALKARNVKEPWFSLWKRLIYVRTIADDVRVLMSSYYRAIRYGVEIPDDIKKQVLAYFKEAGITQEEMAIRDLATLLDLMRESLPTLSRLATFAEYIDVPLNYINKIVTLRRIERTYAELWLRYVQARTISTEVSRIVSVFERIYERYAVPQELITIVRDLMAKGGWTARELELFDFELYLRRLYRMLMRFIPTIRQFVADSYYLPNYEALFESIIQAYGIEIEKYRAQVEYYKRLMKNRRLWRHFSRWFYALQYAYYQGAITLDEAKKRLEEWKKVGLVDDDEINILLDALELRRRGYAAYLARYYSQYQG